MVALHPITARRVDAALSGTAAARQRSFTNAAASARTNKPIPAKEFPLPKGGAKEQGKPVFQSPGLKLAAPNTPNGPATGVPMSIVAPFLTPAQTAALAAFDARYNAQVTRTNNGLANDTINTNAALASAQKNHDVGTSTANQNAAARGLFQSSIRDGALNDIDTTLVTRQNILNTALRNSAITAQTNLAALSSSFAAEHQLYNTYAAGNAAGVTPNPGVGDANGATPAPASTTPQTPAATQRPKADSSFTPVLPSSATMGFDPKLTSGKAESTGAKLTTPKMPKGGGKVSGGPVSRTGNFPVGPPGMGA